MSSIPTTPVFPRPSATVMVVRPQPAEYEVFMVRRHQASKFAADQYVFPGGTIRPDDSLGETEAREVGLDPVKLHQVLASHDDPFAERDDGGIALWVAALRELFEEAGILLASDAADHESSQLLDLSAPGRAARFSKLRLEVQEGRLSLAQLARSENLRLAADRLAYFSRWLTPVVMPRRFDTRFFVAELPAGQTAEHCQIETSDGIWLSPREALARHDRDDFPMMFVTSQHVKRLAEFTQTSALLDYTRTKSVRPVQAVLDDGQDTPYLPPEQERTW